MARVIVCGRDDEALTRHLVERLAESLEVVLRPGGLEAADLSPEAAAPVAALVYLPANAASGAHAPDPEHAERFFARLAAAGLEPGQRLVLLSSAAVHEPNAHHPGHVDEGHPPSRREGNPIAAAWRALEERAGESAGEALAVLRPPIVRTPGGEGYFDRLFSSRLAARPMGFDPSLQVLHADDLAAALELAVSKPVAGVFHLPPRGVVPLRRALASSGVRALPLPWPARTLSASRAQLDYLRHGFTISSRRAAAELGFEAERSSLEALQAVAGRDGPAEAGDFDDFGLDKGYTAKLGRTLFRFLHNVWWRVEHRGLEHVPRRGPAVLAGIHRGHQPWDGVMTYHLIARELGRHARFLIHPTLVKFPFLAPYMIKLGGMHACAENADRVLGSGGLLGVYPEGIRGAFTPYKHAYRLGRFGRGAYVRFALRNRAPIVPFVTVGSAEIFPILGRIDWSWWKRRTEWPYLPITPTMGTVPLPSKWHTRFLEPMPVQETHPPEAAEDREVVRAISREVRRRLEEAMGEMRRRRRSVFYGSIFDEAYP